MENLKGDTIRIIDWAFHRLEALVPPPAPVKWSDGFRFRYVEKTIEQAIIIKLARTATGTRALLLLNLYGLYQEQASIQRMLDEYHEDCTFLSLGIRFKKEEIHDNFIKYLFIEEIIPNVSPIDSKWDRPTVPRKKIRAYIARVTWEESGRMPELNPSRGTHLGKTISGAYSGYVHAAAPNVLELYGGDPPRFHLGSMIGTPREADHGRDLLNYLYRGVMAFETAAAALGDTECSNLLANFSKRVSQTMETIDARGE